MLTARPANRPLAFAVIALTSALAACGSSDQDGSPTAPSSITPPSASAAVRYSAIGASDANGVGASVPCVPFTTCDNGTGYVPLLARLMRGTREVVVNNLGIPAAVLSPTIYDISRSYGRDIPANFIEREMPFVATDATLVTVFGGPNDVNALGDAMQRGAGASDVRGYVDTQIRAFGADFDRLLRGIRERAPRAFIIVLNIPNMAGLPYAAGYTVVQRQLLQQISVGFSREANRQAGNGVVVLDLMCDARIYDPSSFSSDGFHPNDSGYAYLAQRLLAIVNGAGSSPSASCAQMTLVS